jgi:predicted GNAT family acetyltransferase
MNNNDPLDDRLDEALEETFPASDPPAITVETTGPAVEADAVRDNVAANRFELREGDELAFLTYERKPDAMVFVHTEVPPRLRGRHVGESLVRTGLAAARSEGLRIVAVCPFVRAYLAKHPGVS